MPADASLMSNGLDSMAATQLANTFEELFQVNLPSTLMFDHPTTSALVAHFLTTINQSTAVA